MNTKNREIKGMLSIIACQSLFGFSFLFAKLATDVADPFSLLGWRFTVAFLTMAIVVKLGFIKVSFSGKDLKPLVLLSIFTPVLNYLLETIGISMTSSSESGAMVACLPIACMITSSLILRKPPDRSQSIGIAVTVIGVMICIFARGFTSDFHMMGNVLIVVSVFCNAIFTALSERAAHFTSSEKTFSMLFMGMTVFMPLAIIRNALNGTVADYFLLPFNSRMFLISILYLGIACSLITFILNNNAISIIGTTRTSSFGGISTIVSIFAGIIILSESFILIQIIGTVMVLVGAYVANAKAIRDSL